MKALRVTSLIAWWITERAEAAQRFAHALDDGTPTPDDGDRYFDAGVAAGVGDFATMMRLSPTINMLDRAAKAHGMCPSEVVAAAER